MKTAIKIGCVLIVLAGFVLFGIPLGSEVSKREIIGRSSDGREIVEETRNDFKIFPFSPEGFFFKTYITHTTFLERKGSKESKLRFLNGGSEYGVLRPVLCIEGTEEWAAFRLVQVEREKVNLHLDIFDRKKVLQSYEIHQAVRCHLSADTFDSIDSYSIFQNPTNNEIQIRTTNGLLIYDQDSRILKGK